VPSAGKLDNDLILAFDGSGWREIRLGYNIADMCVTDDSRYLVLFAGGREVTKPQFSSAGALGFDGGSGGSVTSNQRTYEEYDVYVMDHEVQTYDPPERTHIYESAWIRADDTALAPVNVHELFIGMVDEADETIDVYVYSNGSYDPDEDSPRTTRAVGVQAEDLIGDLVLGTGKDTARRLCWRRVTINLENVNTWSFELRSTNPHHIAAFAFSISQVTSGDPLARIPLGGD